MWSSGDGHAPTFLPQPNGTASTNLGPQSHHLLPRIKRDRKNDKLANFRRRADLGFCCFQGAAAL